MSSENKTGRLTKPRNSAFTNGNYIQTDFLWYWQCTRVPTSRFQTDFYLKNGSISIYVSVSQLFIIEIGVKLVKKRYMNIELVTKRLFHSFHLFVDINRLYFDNIEIAPIFLKTHINKIRNQIEIFSYIWRFSNFISNRF